MPPGVSTRDIPGNEPDDEGQLQASAVLTLRDYFAAKAMQAILYETIKIEGDATTHRIARDAYRVADAMLEERQS